MYSVLDYGHMIDDRVRMDAYLEALKRAVRPGSVVLDAGTGTGIFAMIACRLGARRVYAVEPGPAIATARQLARANGLADRIDFRAERLEDVALPERVDVLVSDMRGSLPLCGTHLSAIRLARERFLAPGGVQIPQRDHLRAAPVDASPLYERNAEIWSDNRFGFDLAEARSRVVNSLWTAGDVPSELLADAATLCELDYTTIESPSVRGEARWTVARPGRLNAVLLWFDATIAPGIGFSNAPGQPDTVYGRLCLPLPRTTPVQPGDTVEIRLAANLVQDDYVWTWTTTVGSRSGARVNRWRQSTFFGSSLGSEGLRTAALDHAPGLAAEGQIQRAVLAAMETGLPIEAIARRVAKQFPDRYPTWNDALSRVGSMAATFGCH